LFRALLATVTVGDAVALLELLALLETNLPLDP